MPTVTIKIKVQNKRQGEPERIAVADAMQYLAYADQTDVVGYLGKVQTVDVVPAWVTITIDAPMVKGDIERFREEMENLSRVEFFRCLTNPNV